MALSFLRLATVGFAGAIALVGYMERDLVERRAWLSRDDDRAGLALAQLAAGAIAGAAFVLASRAIIDLPTAAIAVATLAALSWTKIPEPVTVLAAGLVSMAIGAAR